MAIDSSLFMCDIAAGSFSVGDIVPMVCTDGPANVRSGRGAAILKRTMSFKVGAGGCMFEVVTQNQDWIDPVINEAPALSATTLDRRTGAYQSGNNCPLTQNSAFTVYARCVIAGTATAGTIFNIIEIDYPEVSSITDPDAILGIPTTIEQAITSVPEAAAGAGVAATWAGGSVDFFKAGYVYALQKVSAYGAGTGSAVFVSISNAAGMGGLTRIIPVLNQPDSIRAIVEYASRLQKGPLDLKVKAIGTSGTDNIGIILDFVKRRIA